MSDPTHEVDAPRESTPRESTPRESTLRESTLREVLEHGQRLGLLGDRPVPEVIAHARHFVTALSDVTGCVVDLGSGGGVPGLVLAVDRPDLSLVLVDRRQGRTDVLRRSVLRLGLASRVEVRCEDVADLARAVPGTFDAVTARGFGPPGSTLRWAATLVRPGGTIVVSEPPAGSTPHVERWPDALLDELRVTWHRHDVVAVFRRRH